MRRGLLGLWLGVALAGCPSSRDAVDGAVEAGFTCNPAEPSEGQCPDGAVCGLEERCHARVSGAWKCDPAANAPDGTNVSCFGEPLDVCGADSRCHSAGEVPQSWACSEDSQCLNGRRCSEASWTCVETAAEALLPSPLPPEGAVEVLPSRLRGLGESALIAASGWGSTCTSTNLLGQLSLRLPSDCPEGTLRNRIQAFAQVEGDLLRTWIVGQSPLGADPRTWLAGPGIHALPEVGLSQPVRAGLMGVAVVRGSTESYLYGEQNQGVFPFVAWVDAGGILQSRAFPNFMGQRNWAQLVFGGPPPAEAEVKVFSKPADPGVSDSMAQVLIRSHASVRSVRWPQLWQTSTSTWVFPATGEMGAIEDVAPLPQADGVVVVTSAGTFFRFANPPDAGAQGWHAGQSLTSLPDLTPDTQARLNALLAGPRELRLNATSDSAQVVMTVRSTDPGGAATFMVLPSTDAYGCGNLAPIAIDSRVCFRVACEPCATARGERALEVGWTPGLEGEPSRYLVRCDSPAGVRTVSVRAQRPGDGPMLTCRIDASTDALGRDGRALTPIAHSNAAAFKDAHNVLAVLPRDDGSAELVATGLDRAPHGVVRLNGKLAAFTANRTWKRELNPAGKAVGAFAHAPLAGMSMLGAVHAPPAFSRTLLVASSQGEASVMDVTEASLDMFPVAAIFQRAPEATDAQHHSVVVQTPASFSATGLERAFTLFTTADDSLLGAEVSSMMSASPLGTVAELSVRTTPQPGSALRSVAFTEPFDDAGVPLFARGFLLTDNGLFGFEAVSPKRFRSFMLPSRESPWVGLYTEGAPLASPERPARARLVYRDGVVVSLPSQLPLSAPLPTRDVEGRGDALVAVLHHCGHTYGLSERTLFHLTVGPGQAVGAWEDLLQNVDAEARPFAAGALLRDGDTLYLFGSAGHARTWTAPACPSGG